MRTKFAIFHYKRVKTFQKLNDIFSIAKMRDPTSVHCVHLGKKSELKNENLRFVFTYEISSVIGL